MPFENIDVARADVVYTTNLGQFRAEQDQVQAVYARTTGAMQDEALKLAIAQERLNRAIAQQGPESYAAAKATVAYRAQVDELARSEVAAAAASERAARQRLSAYAGAARSVGSTLTRYVTVPTALLTAAAVKMGIDFQQQMLLIQTQAGASAGEVHKLSGEVLQLAHVAPQGPAELAKGLYHLESLGLRGAKAMDTLRISALAAGMGIADLESTASALGAVVVTGIQGAQNYDQAMGTLVGTVGAGNVRMEDLAASIGNVAPAAAAGGISLTELGAAIATLTDRGFSADEAATRLRISLALIQSPSAKAKKALSDMGIDANSLGATLREPNGLLKVLDTLHAGMESVGKVRGNRDLLAAFGGGRSGLGIQTLVQSLDSTVSSYQQKLGQVDTQSQKFAANQKAYLHSQAYELHHDLATIEADLTSAGTKIAPVFVDVADGVAKVADEFGHLPAGIKTDVAVVVGVLAFGGPLLLAIAKVITSVQTIGGAFKRVPGAAGEAVAATDAELATLRAQAAATAAALEAAGAEGGAGLAAGIGAGVTKSEAELASLSAVETEAGAGGLLGGLGGLGGIGRAGAYGIGGLVAGQVIQGVVPGQAGRSLGSAAQLAGLGAAVGSFIEPGVGTAIGAGLGAIVGGVASLIHSGPSFTQQIDAMGQSLDRFEEKTAATGHTVLALRQQIANDHVGRDQARQELAAARAEERATRGTAQHAAAVDQLRAAQVNLDGATRQISDHTAQLAKVEKAHAAAITPLVVKFQDVRRSIEGTVAASVNRWEPAMSGAARKARDAAQSTQQYIDQLNGMASSMQKSDPKIALVATELANVATNLHRIPDKKTVELIIKSVYETHGKPPAPGVLGGFRNLRAAAGAAQAADDKAKGHHTPAPFTVTIPVGLQIDLQRAENAGDVQQQRKLLHQELSFLEAELKKAERAHNKQDELAALQAIGSVDSQLQSLQSSAGTRTKRRQSAYQQKVDEEANRLKINLARAQLAEKAAGANKTLLDRAHKAERRAIQDEISFYRREAHDHELSLRERQKYARLQIAAEQAKLKIGKQTAQQIAATKQAETQVLADLQTILQNYAPNVFPGDRKPHVEVHQHFPAQPTDHHRHARYALAATRAAFDS